MCRKRGRIVLVGVTGLELSRDDLFEKEIRVQVSCSYGPGRYDASYEEGGVDYPVGFVRWTEQRNFEAVLEMMATGRLDVKPLISHAFPIDRASEAYAVIVGPEPSLGIILTYPPSSSRSVEALRASTVELPVGGDRTVSSAPAVAFVGAGNYATRVLIPAFKASGARLVSIASNGGVSGTHAAKKFGFPESTTDASSLFANAMVDAVVVTTRHDSHADLAVQSLCAGKHLFVEKPLCLTLADLARVEAAYNKERVHGGGPPVIMVGFNRRFAPLARKVKSLLASTQGPKAFVMTVNAGAIPANHWTQDRKVGGGRLVGEACHFIDFLRFLAGVSIVGHSRSTMGSPTGDSASLQLEFADGSIGTVHYLANGPKAFPKERLEVFANGRVLQLDNFRKVRAYGWPGFSRIAHWRQDKGQRACAAAFLDAIRRGVPSPIPFEELVEVSRVAIQLA